MNFYITLKNKSESPVYCHDIGITIEIRATDFLYSEGHHIGHNKILKGSKSLTKNKTFIFRLNPILIWRF